MYLTDCNYGLRSKHFKGKASLNFNEIVDVTEFVTFLFEKKAGLYSSSFSFDVIFFHGGRILLPITSLILTVYRTYAPIAIGMGEYSLKYLKIGLLFGNRFV